MTLSTGIDTEFLMDPVVRALALRTGDPGFKTHSCHWLNLFLVAPGSTSQPTGLPPAMAGILNRCCWMFCSVVIVFPWPWKAPMGSGQLSMYVYVFNIWLAPWAGKMNQIPRCDWLPERARWSYTARSGFLAWSRKIKDLRSINTQKKTWPIFSHLDLTLGQ